MAERDAEWDVRPVPPRVVAIGDLHGDVRAFGAIARACGLVDEGGTWIGQDAHLVLMGDLVGGAQSRLLLNAVIRLEREARRAGGRVHALLGNHDVLPAAGRFEKMTRGERRAWIAHHQGRGPKPPEATQWTMDEDKGPMWTFIDTRISDDERGQLGALIVQRGALSTLYARDRADGAALAEREARERARRPSFFSLVFRALTRHFRRWRS
jgi:hypothetical protein